MRNRGGTNGGVGGGGWGGVSGGMKINFIGNYRGKEAEPLFFSLFEPFVPFFPFSLTAVFPLFSSLSSFPPLHHLIPPWLLELIGTQDSPALRQPSSRKKIPTQKPLFKGTPSLSWRIIVLCSELQNSILFCSIVFYFILFYSLLFYSLPSTNALWAYQANLKKTKSSEIFLLLMLKLGVTKGPQSRWRQTAARVPALALTCETPTWL